jgi:hypothetical protein
MEIVDGAYRLEFHYYGVVHHQIQSMTSNCPLFVYDTNLAFGLCFDLRSSSSCNSAFL